MRLEAQRGRKLAGSNVRWPATAREVARRRPAVSKVPDVEAPLAEEALQKGRVRPALAQRQLVLTEVPRRYTP